MRTKLSFRNMYVGILSQLIIVLLGFISRKVFIDSLGIHYLGLNGLLTSILSMMALVESGIGISIVYLLYKPLAEQDHPKVIALVQLYKKFYWILSLIILLIGCCIFPFLHNFIKDGASISNLTIIYFLFIAKSMVSYLNAHKWSLITADQRGYIITSLNTIYQIITTIIKIVILLLTQDFILYLLVELIIYIIQNIANGRVVDKRYPYIKTNIKYRLDSETRKNLIKNVKALFLHNIGGFLVFGTDNLLISSYIGIATVGLYSNYTMITQQITALINPILGGIDASVGNLIATENRNKNYSIFKITYLMNFWIFSIIIICLFNLLEPFINWWIGEGYLLDRLTFTFILINLYLTGMRTAIAIFKNKAGLFTQDKFAPLIEGGINLVASLILVKYFGLAGIFMGTTISTLSTIFWTQPVIVYKNLFVQRVYSYFSKYAYFGALTLMTCILTTFICNQIVVEQGFLSLIIKGIVCLIIPNIIYLILFHKTEEFQYIKKVLGGSLLRVKSKATLSG
ncbi:lipopolysaccharide biosynthesis protein [Bacillus sp. AK128]